MSMIQLEDVTFSYPGSDQTILEHVNLQIDTDWKLGFIGRNGRGKTTLLQLLSGRYEYRGRIHCPVPVHYFPMMWATKPSLRWIFCMQSVPWRKSGSFCGSFLCWN